MTGLLDSRGLAPGPVLDAPAEFRSWWDRRRAANEVRVTTVPFDELEGWRFVDDGDLVHATGRFFSVTGLEARAGLETVAHQPVIRQPEVGILGMLITVQDGVTRCLVQAKVEPGNCNGLQLSPTVQATRSNYTRVHNGRRPPYLEHFVDAGRRGVRSDVIQSEQGSWFWHKSNRNMIVCTDEPAGVELEENFAWVSLSLLRQLLAAPDLVNMDSRTVLSGMPCDVPEVFAAHDDAFGGALLRSWRPGPGTGRTPLHDEQDILSWFTATKAECDHNVRLVPLRTLNGWTRTAEEIVDDRRSRFRIVGVDVRAAGREVAQWTQPLLEPFGVGQAVLLVRVVDGVLHLLFQAKAEYGLLDRVELGPSVQLSGTASGGALEQGWLPERGGAGTARFDTVLSEEGGRFRNARTRYRIVEVGAEVPLMPTPRHRWLTMHQVAALIRHGHYFNVEARTLISCLGALVTADDA